VYPEIAAPFILGWTEKWTEIKWTEMTENEQK